MTGLTFSKTELAERLEVTKGRVSQLVAEGLPVLPDGTVDALEAGQWVLAHLKDRKAAATREAALAMMRQAHLWRIVAATAAEVPLAVALAAGEAGLSRAQAERVANMATLFWASALNEALEAAGLPELQLPHPEAWPRRINWPALFGEGAAKAG